MNRERIAKQMMERTKRLMCSAGRYDRHYACLVCLCSMRRREGEGGEDHDGVRLDSRLEDVRDIVHQFHGKLDPGG